MMRDIECPWCGGDIDLLFCDEEVYEEGDHDVECPECGMPLIVKTEYVVKFDVDVWDARTRMRPCDDRGCGFYGIGCCAAGSLDANLEPPEGVPAWCPRLKGGRK